MPLLFKIFLILIAYIKCNLWDNIFSHQIRIKKNLFELPEEFEIDLFSDKKKINFMGKIYVSCKLNKFKLIFNLNNNSLNKEDYFLNIIGNLNKSSVLLINEEKCNNYSVNLFNNLTIKFFLNSYDLISYYYNVNETIDYYIITNPLQIKINNKFETIFDKEFYINFITNLNNLSNIEIKYYNFKAKFYTELKKKDFIEKDFDIEITYKLFSQCELINYENIN